MIITFRVGQEKVKEIKVEGEREKRKEVIVHHEIASSNGKYGIMTIFHGTGTKIISPRKRETI
jgi:hypothetical protein